MHTVQSFLIVVLCGFVWLTIILSLALAEEITIYDKDWQVKERIQDGTIYDRDWDGKVYARNWNPIRRPKEMRILPELEHERIHRTRQKEESAPRPSAMLKSYFPTSIALSRICCNAN